MIGSIESNQKDLNQSFQKSNLNQSKSRKFVTLIEYHRKIPRKRKLIKIQIYRGQRKDRNFQGIEDMLNTVAIPPSKQKQPPQMFASSAKQAHLQPGTGHTVRVRNQAAMWQACPPCRHDAHQLLALSREGTALLRLRRLSRVSC